VGGLLAIRYGAALAWVPVRALLYVLSASLSLAKIDPRIWLGGAYAASRALPSLLRFSRVVGTGPIEYLMH
jgi:hypothetical protein